MYELVTLLGCLMGTFVSDALSTGEMKFSVISSRNRSGHWNAQLHLEHGDNDGLPLEMDVIHKTTRYEHGDSIIIMANIAAPPLRPGQDYELLPGLGYYKFHFQSKNWYDARKTCEMEGAHLVVINSEEESRALLKFWLPHPSIGTWASIGVHDHYKDGQFITIFDKPFNVTGITSWEAGQPSGGALQNCVASKRNSGTLNDVNCNDKFPFFCEV